MTGDDETQFFDVVVVGGGPAGATAAADLARAGRSVLLLDKAGRIKPCGGAIPTRLINDFEIPAELICAQIRAARMVSPTHRHVDMAVDVGPDQGTGGGYVGMVDRDRFDEYLRDRAAGLGAVRRTGAFERIRRDRDGTCVSFSTADRGVQFVRTRLVIGADGALSKVARQEIDAKGPPCVFAYHEIVRAPTVNSPGYDAGRCDVVYDGTISPDFYGWVFPHGATASIGAGSAEKGFSLRGSVAALRAVSGLSEAETVRREGAPIPMKPLKRWDNGRDVVLAGDAAGVVAPASGEGIYYAMAGGRLAAEAGLRFLESGDAGALKLARKRFMKEHGKVFFILRIMQYFWYKNDRRRERFVSICRDKDVQLLTWQAYLNKKLVRKKPWAHVRIFFKDVAHLLGLAKPTVTRALPPAERA